MSQTAEKPDKIQFTPYQEQFLRGDKRYFGFVSGVGAGKTFVGCWRTWLNMEKWNPGEMGAIVAPTRQMIVNVILPEMRELGFLDRWDYKSSHSDSPGLHSPNGSRALLLSADNRKTIERLRGLNLAWWHIDEKTAVPRRAQEILEQRLRAGEYRNGYITTTPKGKDDTFNFFVDSPNATQETFGEATIYNSKDRLAVVGVPTDANPHLPNDYKTAMEQDMPEDIRAQEVQGQFVEIGAGVFSRDMLHFVDPQSISEDKAFKTIISVDPAATVDAQAAEDNDSDYWGVCVGQVDRATNTIYLTDTAHRRGMSLQEGVSWIRGITRQADSPTVVVEANQSQVWLQNALKEAGINAIPEKTTRNKEDKLIDLSIPLENSTVQFVDWNDDKPGTNHPYDELVSELLAFPEGAHDDLLDALYLLVDNAGISWGTSIMGGDVYGREE